MLQAYPTPDESKISADAEADMAWIMEFVMGIRKIRGEMNIPPSKPLTVILDNVSELDQKRLENSGTLISKLARTSSIDSLANGEQAPESATALVGDMKVLIPMAGLINKDEELARLDKEIAKLNNELKRLTGKLSNPKYVDKAPKEVVEKEQEKKQHAESKLQNLSLQREKIASL